MAVRHVVEIPGRAAGGVRIYEPAAGKSSYRVIWRDDRNVTRERTTTDWMNARSLATQIANSLAINSPPPSEFENPTLGELLNYYINGPGRPRRWTSPKSERRMTQIARRVLQPSDLELSAQDLIDDRESSELHRIITHAEEVGCAKGGWDYEKAGSLLHSLFAVAAAHDLVRMPEGNPMRTIPFRVSRVTAVAEQNHHDRLLQSVRYISEDERPPTHRVREFIEITRELFGDLEALYVETLAFSGLRPGEANALQPRHILAEKPIVQVAQQIVELRRTEAARMGKPTLMVGATKSRAVRETWATPELHQRLTERGQQVLLSGRSPFLFPAPRGGIRRQRNWSSRIFDVVAEAASWPARLTVEEDAETGEEKVVRRDWDWTVYSFRHHYANYMLKDLKRPPAVVARFLGHSDVRVTMRMYLKKDYSDFTDTTRAYNDSQGTRDA